MHTSSSPSPSLVVAEGRADEVGNADRVKSLVVIEEGSEEDNGNDTSYSTKLRRHSNSNGSSAGSPLTPSAAWRGLEEPHQQVGSSLNAAEVQLSSNAPLSRHRLLVAPSAASSSAAQSQDEPSASNSHDARPHVLRVDVSAAVANGVPGPRRMARTLRLQPAPVQGPSAPLPLAKEGQQAEGAPPTKRLRLSLTAAANPPTGSLSSSEAPVAATSTGRGRMLQLIPPTPTTPPIAASGCVALRAPSPAKRSQNEAQELETEKAAQAPSLAATTATAISDCTHAVADAPLPATAAAVTAAAAPAPTSPPPPVGGPARPTPILVNPCPPQEDVASPLTATGAAARLAELSPWNQPQQPLLQQRPSSSVATAAACSPSEVVDGRTFPRLRSLTPQPYANTQGSPRRRHRFVNVNLPSAPPPLPTELASMFQRTVRDVYDVHEKLSEGTYGEVFKGVDKRTGAPVALKRLKMLSSHQGFPQTSLREVIALRHIQNQRERLEARQRQRMSSGGGGSAKVAVADPLAEVAQLYDVLVFDRQQPDIVLVFAYATASLAGVLRRQLVFAPSELAYLIKKLLTAVRKLHVMSIIHRDIKSDNVLITSDGEVQLTDFGLCSIVSSGGASTWRTPGVITLAYRPPEMLLGSTAYDEKVDVWSVGCLLAQLYLHEPPFYRHRALQQGLQGPQQQPQRTAATELEQLARITDVLGPLPPVRVFHPDACRHMHVLEQLEQQGRLAESGKAAQPPNWGRLQSLFEPSFLYQQFHGFRGWFEAEVQRSRHQPQRRPTQACLDVLCAALQLDPQQRPSAAELLRMPYFTTLDDAPLTGGYQRPLAATPEREEEVRHGLMLKVQRCGDSHTQRRPH
ncbi:putative protein kinase [Leptomonas seymouri]|uniref:Protein kinase domain-containing protein n=1 Tax=Leptomonas seymouri TaxID=5684 RepID=A0A0N1PB28_LEPSE|nr:putative protein kinase [Leptomonas seymouri]|eukprot:KPI86298.1 putative protein kinase [Leptomonas seymouri]